MAFDYLDMTSGDKAPRRGRYNSSHGTYLRVLVDYRDLPVTFSYYLATRTFAEQSASVLQSLLEELATAGAWPGGTSGRWFSPLY